jgi:mRNA interferase MazF
VELRRGAVVLVRGVGEGDERLRPCVVVQSDIFNDTHSSITLCPVTDAVGGERLFRVPVSPSAENGLRAPSDIQADRLQSIRRERIVEVVGKLSTTRMEQVDQALQRWLAL